MVTVLIPSVGRPDMLKLALQSVADQTALAQISRVFVSENGGDRTSETLCAEFPQLPITYAFREPALTPLGHARVLLKEGLQEEFTCILHDDDLWLPGHVADALAAFAAHEEASVYGANYIPCTDDGLRTERDCSLMAWVASGYAPKALWRLSHTNILLTSFLNFIVHYSSMVVRTDALRQAAYVYEMDNPYDNDRMILFALSRLGPVLYNPMPSLVVRVHANRETARFAQDERNRRMCETTRWMAGMGTKSWSTLAAAFAQKLTACPEGETKIQLLREAALKEWCLPEISRHLDRAQDREFFAMYDRLREMFAGEKPQEDR